MPIDNGCTILFKYDLIEGLLKNQSKHFRVQVQKQTDCITSHNAMGTYKNNFSFDISKRFDISYQWINISGVALGVITSTVIIGFSILLIWKLITIIQDRREFAKFEQERSMVRWERVSETNFMK